jgi:hypothetical protein
MRVLWLLPQGIEINDATSPFSISWGPPYLGNIIAHSVSQGLLSARLLGDRCRFVVDFTDVMLKWEDRPEVGAASGYGKKHPSGFTGGILPGWEWTRRPLGRPVRWRYAVKCIVRFTQVPRRQFSVQIVKVAVILCPVGSYPSSPGPPLETAPPSPGDKDGLLLSTPHPFMPRKLSNT